MKTMRMVWRTLAHGISTSLTPTPRERHVPVCRAHRPYEGAMDQMAREYVRELAKAMERTAILPPHDVITPDDLSPHLAAGTPRGPAPALPRE